MKTKDQYLRMPGPVLGGRQRTALVVIRRAAGNTVSVMWSAYDLRQCGNRTAYDGFRTRLDAAGMLRAVEAWLAIHANGLPEPTPRRMGNACAGGVRNLTPELADTLAGLVCGYYTHALEAE